MTAISTAVGLDRISRVSGYRIKKGFFDQQSVNLPQVIAVFGEANTANQGTLSTDKKEITSAEEAGVLFGYGSPIHQQMRILRPENGIGVGGIPTIVFPQETDAAATATEEKITVSGTASKNARHYVKINGRTSINFKEYSYSVVKDDAAAQIAQKISDAVNSILESPVTAVVNVSNEVELTTKWEGATSAYLNVSIQTDGENAGLTYSISNTSVGSGDVDLQAAFNQFGNDWITTIVNPYESKLDLFEQFNGVPYGSNPTGRYTPIIFKPFMSFVGSTTANKNDLTSLTSSRSLEVTNVICTAPNSEAFNWEVAASYVRLFSKTMQDTPHLTISNKALPDLPKPKDGIIGDMADYNDRDFLVKRGVSTVVFENDAYLVQDLVTTYSKEGEVLLQYSYCRNLNLDWNIKDGYDILESRNVRDHVIIQNNQVSDAQKTVKPKQWKAVLFDYLDELSERALIREPQFSKDSLQVEVNATNPNRFDTFLKYKRTGVARIESTDVQAGF